MGVYGVDIGSVRGRFGWWRVDGGDAHAGASSGHGGNDDIVALADAISVDLAHGRRIACGFDSPLSIPVPEDAGRLGSARVGEASKDGTSRPWSAGAGAMVLPTGIVQVAWILRSLRHRHPDVSAHLDWAEFVAAGGMFLWEAFISDEAKTTSHVGDARLAAGKFVDAMPGLPARGDVHTDNPLSLLGAAMLWSGWSNDPAILHQAALVVKVPPPQRPTAGQRITATLRERRRRGGEDSV